jgi:hypothetical protein
MLSRIEHNKYLRPVASIECSDYTINPSIGVVLCMAMSRAQV